MVLRDPFVYKQNTGDLAFTCCVSLTHSGTLLEAFTSRRSLSQVCAGAGLSASRLDRAVLRIQYLAGP